VPLKLSKETPAVKQQVSTWKACLKETAENYFVSPQSRTTAWPTVSVVTERNRWALLINQRTSGPLHNIAHNDNGRVIKPYTGHEVRRGTKQKLPQLIYISEKQVSCIKVNPRSKRVALEIVACFPLRSTCVSKKTGSITNRCVVL